MSLDYDSVVKIMGVSKVRIKMIDRVIYIMKDMTNVLKILKNLISSSLLNS